MRKEKLKIYIDNLEQINKELEPKFPQESEFTVDELQEPKLVIEKIYNHLSRTAKDILDMVKRMFKAIGMEVIYLKRISMGKLKLDDTLMLGDYRELTAQEIAQIGGNV